MALFQSEIDKVISKTLSCRFCRTETTFFIRRKEAANGDFHIAWMCGHCTRWLYPVKWINHQIVSETIEKKTSGALSIYDIPFAPGTENSHSCFVCGSPYVENHHFAPRYLFDDECERWPQAFLCKKCHARWHRKVTPNMCNNIPGKKHAS